jgi:hypothetical protein
MEYGVDPLPGLNSLGKVSGRLLLVFASTKVYPSI